MMCLYLFSGTEILNIITQSVVTKDTRTKPSTDKWDLKVVEGEIFKIDNLKRN